MGTCHPSMPHRRSVLGVVVLLAGFASANWYARSGGPSKKKAASDDAECKEHPGFPMLDEYAGHTCFTCESCTQCQWCDRCMEMPSDPDLLCSAIRILPRTGGKGECKLGSKGPAHGLNWGHRKGIIGDGGRTLDVAHAFILPVSITGVRSNYRLRPYQVYTSSTGGAAPEEWTPVPGGPFKGNATFDPPLSATYFARMEWDKSDGNDSEGFQSIGIQAQFTGSKVAGPPLCEPLRHGLDKDEL